LSFVEIGDCPDHMHFTDNYYGYFCARQKKIYLGKYLTERTIERSLNHEILHLVLQKRIGKKACKRFDNIFAHGTNSVERDGCTNDKDTDLWRP